MTRAITRIRRVAKECGMNVGLKSNHGTTYFILKTVDGKSMGSVFFGKNDPNLIALQKFYKAVNIDDLRELQGSGFSKIYGMRDVIFSAMKDQGLLDGMNIIDKS